MYIQYVSRQGETCTLILEVIELQTSTSDAALRAATENLSAQYLQVDKIRGVATDRASVSVTIVVHKRVATTLKVLNT